MPNSLRHWRRYQQVKDSVNNVIMSEELIETANDLDYGQDGAQERDGSLKERGYILIICLAVIIIFILTLFH